MLTIKYYDFGPYEESTSNISKERTDNDIEAMNALDALSVEFNRIKNQVEAMRSENGTTKRWEKPPRTMPYSAAVPDREADKPLPPLMRQPEPQVEPDQPATHEPPQPEPSPPAQPSRGSYWDTYFSSGERKTSHQELDADPELDDTYYDADALDVLVGMGVSDAKPPDEEEAQGEQNKPGVKAWFQKWRQKSEQSRAPRTQPDTEEVLAAPRYVNKAQRYSLVGLASMATLVLLALTIIAEPWVPPPADEYLEPQAAALDAAVTLEVGETYTLNVPCGENEVVHEIYSQENDILSVMDNSVQALGQWDSVTVVVKTMEKEIPQPELKAFSLFGQDLTQPYNNLRANLRAFIGVEPKQEPRTEKRVLHIYEQEFKISGYEIVAASSPINLYTQDYYELTVMHGDHEEVVFTYEGNVIEVEKTVPDDDGYVTYLARSADITGTGKIIATIGFYKDGTFVPTGGMEFDVEVLNRPTEGEQAIFTSGSYNGNIRIETEDGEQT